ncbi:4460_t:CDS:2, partial [Dentiscutata erythropus]
KLRNSATIIKKPIKINGDEYNNKNEAGKPIGNEVLVGPVVPIDFRIKAIMMKVFILKYGEKEMSRISAAISIVAARQKDNNVNKGYSQKGIDADEPKVFDHYQRYDEVDVERDKHKSFINYRSPRELENINSANINNQKNMKSIENRKTLIKSGFVERNERKNIWVNGDETEVLSKLNDDNVSLKAKFINKIYSKEKQNEIAVKKDENKVLARCSNIDKDSASGKLA